MCPATAEPSLALLVEAVEKSCDGTGASAGDGERGSAGAQQQLCDAPAALGVKLAQDAARDECAFCRKRELATAAVAAPSAKTEAAGCFLRCSRCRSVKYCCRGHQRQDWPVHKLFCHPQKEREMQQTSQQPPPPQSQRPQPQKLQPKSKPRPKPKEPLQLASTALAFELS